jgi:hypothetical protein
MRLEWECVSAFSVWKGGIASPLAPLPSGEGNNVVDKNST